ncbi:uncharacterized protein LY79DRAFT_564515 [Colletotrichum navitas]|uniref:Uncharacterized protein n=1 Tax=Colletotrichum navitas TaxID=681940 RepID=A0AAD8PRE0_9PEZI|nr:uncharacterized protein LY79DRAFT_564515 [Colletotrichum navitas]KAK1579303.1 hypothetical protein LY79DRAFT_564515 [Colletotrichum navitas]
MTTGHHSCPDNRRHNPLDHGWPLQKPPKTRGANYMQQTRQASLSDVISSSAVGVKPNPESMARLQQVNTNTWLFIQLHFRLQLDNTKKPVTRHASPRARVPSRRSATLASSRSRLFGKGKTVCPAAVTRWFDRYMRGLAQPQIGHDITKNAVLSDLRQIRGVSHLFQCRRNATILPASARKPDGGPSIYLLRPHGQRGPQFKHIVYQDNMSPLFENHRKK